MTVGGRAPEAASRESASPYSEKGHTVTGHPSHLLAQIILDERLRDAAEHAHRHVPGEPRRPSPSGQDAHTLQRALVRASLLLSRREDAPRHRRWA